MVVIEGGIKAVEFMKKLVMRRINWSDEGFAANDGDDGDGGGDGGAGGDSRSGRCAMVWEGAIARPAFHKFEQEECEDVASGRRVLENAHVPQYWDQARSFQVDDAMVAQQKRNL